MDKEQGGKTGEIEITVVSIVVPCHNEEDTIGRCLKAIFESKLPDNVTTEVIVVNDRSTDGSVEIIKGFPVKLVDKRHQRARNPIAETLNLGIERARGRYIAIIEADVEVEREWLVKLLPHFDEENLGIASGYIMVLPDKSWINKLFYLMRLRTFMLARDRNETTDREVFPKMGFCIYRSNVFESVSLFDESIRAMDIMFDLKVRVHGYSHICDMSAIAYDLRGYTFGKFVQNSVKGGLAMYQTGGSVLYMHEQLLFRYIFLSPHYCLTLFKYGRSLVSLLFPVHALIRYFGTIVGYMSAVLRKEPKCPEYLRKKRKENEIRWMRNSFKREIRRLLEVNE